MTNQNPSSIPVLEPSFDLGTEARRVEATAKLAFAREKYPELGRAVATARLDLAAAIIAMDETQDLPSRPNLYEQAAVEDAMLAHGRALAALIRGEPSS